MFAKLSSIQWKGAVRSTMWARNVAANIFIGIAIFLLALNLVSIGLFIDVLFEKATPGIEPVNFINSYLLYYFIIDLSIRLIFQKKHGIIVKPLLLMPVSRNALVHYTLVKSFYSIFNFLPLLVFVPFTFKVVAVNYSSAQALSWILFLTILILSSSFIATYIKKASFSSYKYALYFGLTGAAIFALDKFELISFSAVSAEVFSLPLDNPLYVFLPLMTLVAVYYLNFNFLRTRIYMDNLLPPVSRRTGSSTILQKIEERGETGKYIALELKLLSRNKRSKTTIYFSLSMIFFGWLVYPLYTKDDRFPEPVKEHETFLVEYENQSSGQPDIKKITFKVLTESVPEGATLFIAGNHSVLRNWKADGLPLSMNQDSTWSRTVSFNEGTALKYKITLGTWGRQRALVDGTIPEDYELVVTNDTTIVLDANAWDTPRFKVYSSIFLIYMGILIVGIFMLAYGQFMLGWESSHFDSILGNPVNYEKYFKAKLYIMIISCCIFYVATLPYAAFGIRVLIMNTALFLYNIGVNTYVLLFMACLNRKRLDLDASIMSTQGKGAGQYLSMVPTLLLPVLIFFPFAIGDNSMMGFGFLTGLGLIGVILQKPIMKVIIGFFYKNKYKLATAFRIH